MNVGSLFSGIGGLELGLERAAMRLAWQAEYDKQARRVLARHWPNVPRHEDVHDVRDSAAVDLICGGFPCQDYSVAGKRGGLVGDRGALWWAMHRIAAQYRPTWLVGENVPGLLSSNGGADFRTIVASLVQLGYGVTWATLDSQYFGVAQRRRRLFIVGHSGGVPRPEVLAISEGLFGHPAPRREAGERIAACLEASPASNRSPNIGNGQGNVVVANTITAKDAKGPLPSKQVGNVVVAFDTTQITSALNRSNPKQGDPCHPLAAGAHAPTIAFTAESVHRDGTHQDGTHHPLRTAGHAAVAVGFNGNVTAKAVQEGTPTIGTDGTAYVGVSQPTPRRLTPIECERLQGFPDGWTAQYADGSQVADGPRYRMLGNAVTVNVAEWIGRRIMEAG